jgi:FkbM family methyltransferase
VRIPVGQVTVELNHLDDRVCARGGVFEPESCEVWAGLAMRAGLMIDVGAYSGLYAIGAALYGCTVIAFEPHPANAERLAENAVANGVADQIDLVRGAATDYDGLAEFRFNRKVPLTSGGSLVEQPGRRIVYETIPVPCYRLDSFDVFQEQPVVAVKIDAERAEVQVLRGARQMIERHKPALIVEALDPFLLAQIGAALPGYRAETKLDTSNWLMVPC